VLRFNQLLAPMHKFTRTQSLSEFQGFIRQVYSLLDDRMFSISDLVSQQERFTMRALKGVRKGDHDKIRYNLLTALSWVMTLANRLHIDTEKALLRRFPGRCSYCGNKPCNCKATKPTERAVLPPTAFSPPANLEELQAMIADIYPPQNRTLTDAAIHLAEETGEVSEAVHNFLGEHLDEQFTAIEDEISDYLSCLFGLANSAEINVALGLVELFPDGCHICHQAPCICSFSFVAKFKS